MQTPVDMQAYTQVKNEPIVAAAPRMSMGRRSDPPSTVTMPISGTQTGTDGMELSMHRGSAEYDANLELEVPAFLRRHEE